MESTRITQLNIFLVDDERSIRQALELAFTEQGHTVRVARDGSHALSVLASWTPDIILLDMMMPIMGGLEFLDRIEKLAKEIPVIVLSNNNADAVMMSASVKGAKAYWVKSEMSLDELVEKTINLVQRS